MQLDVAFYWADLPKRDLSRTVVAVADVLRATTVMIAALANGARAVFPQDRDEEARRLHGELSQQGVPVLLSGEKEGYKREGYDLGNSPLEFTPEKVSGKTIVHLTTNGTRALVASSSAREIFLVSFANLSAAAKYLRNMGGEAERILGVVSGREGEYCLEDTVCLGGLLTRLLEPPGWDYSITDAGRTAIDLFQVYRERLPEMIRQCYHGRYLEKIGLGGDLIKCVKMDTTDIVPIMKNGRIEILKWD